MKINNDQITFTIPADAMAKAGEMAARLGTTRMKVLRSFFADMLPSFSDGISAHCLEGGWIFDRPDAAETFLRRERLERKGFAVCELMDEDDRSGGYIVCEMAD